MRCALRADKLRKESGRSESTRMPRMPLRGLGCLGDGRGGRGEGGVRRGWIVRGVDGSRTVGRSEQRDSGHAGCRLGGNDQENLEQGVEKAPAQKRADKRAQGDKGGQKKRQADEDKEHGGSWVARMNGASIECDLCQAPGDNPDGGGPPSGVEEDVEGFFHGLEVRADGIPEGNAGENHVPSNAFGCNRTGKRRLCRPAVTARPLPPGRESRGRCRVWGGPGRERHLCWPPK